MLIISFSLLLFFWLFNEFNQNERYTLCKEAIYIRPILVISRIKDKGKHQSRFPSFSIFIFLRILLKISGKTCTLDNDNIVAYDTYRKCKIFRKMRLIVYSCNVSHFISHLIDSGFFCFLWHCVRFHCSRVIYIFPLLCLDIPIDYWYLISFNTLVDIQC